MQARDALISVARGRPRAVNFADADIAPPCLEDFPHSRAEAELFIPYVDICCLLGDLIECCSRKRMCDVKRIQLESFLFRWTRTLSPNLRLSQKRADNDTYDLLPYNLRARQLHIQYFLCLAILARSTVQPGKVSSAAVVAASFAAGIYEDFLARDQVKLLPPVFTTFCLVSGIILLSVRAYPDLWEAAQPDIGFIKRCLGELSNRWRSAIGALKALQNAIDSSHATAVAGVAAPLAWLDRAQEPLFEGFSLELCRMWSAWERAMGSQERDGNDIQESEIPKIPDHSFPPSTGEGGAAAMDYNFMPNEVEDPYFTHPQYGGLGNWLTFDWGTS